MRSCKHGYGLALAKQGAHTPPNKQQSLGVWTYSDSPLTPLLQVSCSDHVLALGPPCSSPLSRRSYAETGDPVCLACLSA